MSEKTATKGLSIIRAIRTKNIRYLLNNMRAYEKVHALIECFGIKFTEECFKQELEDIRNDPNYKDPLYIEQRDMDDFPENEEWGIDIEEEDEEKEKE